MALWTFELRDSFTMERISDISVATGKQLDLLYNGAGGWQASLPLTHEISDQVQTVKTCIAAKRRATYVWSGPVWTKTFDLINNRLNIAAVGWLEALAKRELRSNLTYNTWQDADIAIDLINRVNDYDPSHPLWVTPGSKTGTFQVRNKAYLRGQKLGPALKELSQIEAGYDIFIDPITREVNFRAWDLFDNKVNTVFTLLSNATATEEAERFRNRIVVTGSPTAAPGLSEDTDSMDEYGVFEDTVALSDVQDTSILQAYAAGERAVQLRGPGAEIVRPPLSYNINPPGRGTIEAIEIPEFIEEWKLGDQVYFDAQKGSFRVSRQAVRPFAVTISIDDNDNEKFSNLQTAPSAD